MTRCSCGRMNESGTRWCTGCGKTVNHTLCLAPNCGTENSLDAQFCRACGSDRLTEGAKARSFSFLPPLLVLSLAVGSATLLWASGLPTAAEYAAFGMMRRLKCYVYEAASVAIVGSCLYLCLPDGWRKSIDALLNLWLKIGKTLVSAAVNSVSWLVRLFATVVSAGKGQKRP